MNGDLISRSVLLESMGNVVFKNVPVEHQPYVQAACDAFEAVAKNVSTVDAEPVRLRIDVYDVDKEKGWYRRLLYCPCGQLIKTETWDAKRCYGTGTVLRENKMPKNCPNCGAKIEGDSDG